jgi:hypothetical protein
VGGIDVASVFDDGAGGLEISARRRSYIGPSQEELNFFHETS